MKSDSKLALWFTISKAITLNKEDLYCAAVYIPPYRSKFSHPHPYLELQNELDTFCQYNRNILLFGEFNSRSAALSDCTECDKFICDLHGNYELFREFSEIVDCFEKCNMSFKRNNVDHVTNLYGYQLVEFCKNNNIFILNGRLKPDSSTPKLTCKDSSTVDYFLSTANMFEFIQSLEVFEFNSLFSDVHCPVSLAINIRDVSVSVCEMESTHVNEPKVKLWDENKSEIYAQNIDHAQILQINDFLDILSDKEITCDDINSVVNRIENLFISNAQKTFGLKRDKTQTSRNTCNKPWFNFECRNARNVYHRSRKLYNKYKTSNYRNMLKRVSKEYKNTISQSVRKFKQERLCKIKELRSNNPKDYWKIINSIDKKKDPSVPLNDLYTFFKEVNSDKNKNEDDTENETENMQNSN